jgi:hypothetical protein
MELWAAPIAHNIAGTALFDIASDLFDWTDHKCGSNKIPRQG